MDESTFFRDYKAKIIDQVMGINESSLHQAAEILFRAYEAGKTVYTIGNGGSASTASHIACDLSKTIRGHTGDSPWAGFKIVCLSDNVGLITAWSNDVGYESVYSGQLQNFGHNGDVLIAISSSGNSPNIISCVRQAQKMGMRTIVIAGFGGGKLKNKGDVSIVSKSQEYGPVEDIQLIVNHMLTNYFYEKFSHQK